MPETTDMDPQNVDPHLSTRIVQSYVRHHTVGTGQVAELITSVHGALAKLVRPIQPEQVRTPAVPVRRSVHQDYVVCLDCGYRAKLLGRHIIKQHGLSPDEYLKRWGLRLIILRSLPAIPSIAQRLQRNAGLAAGRRRRLPQQRCLAKQQHRSIMTPTRRLRRSEGLDLEQSRRMF